MVAEWRQVAYDPVQNVLVIGRAGAVPAATANDIADFLFVAPFDMELLELQATAKVAPTNTHTFQLRRSVNAGDAFTGVGTSVSILASERYGVATQSPTFNINAGDMLNFSTTAGNGSAENVALFIRAQRR